MRCSTKVEGGMGLPAWVNYNVKYTKQMVSIIPEKNSASIIKDSQLYVLTANDLKLLSGCISDTPCMHIAKQIKQNAEDKRVL